MSMVDKYLRMMWKSNVFSSLPGVNGSEELSLSHCLHRKGTRGFCSHTFFPSAFSSLWYAHFLRETAMKDRFISPKSSAAAVLYLWGFCIDFKLYEKGRAKLEEREIYTTHLGTQEHLQADWNAKWHLLENYTMAFFSAFSWPRDNLCLSARQESA